MSNKETRAKLSQKLAAMDTEAKRGETAKFRQLSREVAKLEDSLPRIQRAFPTYR